MIEITVSGRLGGDSEVKALENDRKVINFSIASNVKKFDNSTGELKEKTFWFRCSHFVKSDKVAGYLKKGNRVVVLGSLDFDDYKDKNGVIQHVKNILVNTLEIIDFPNIEEKSTESIEDMGTKDDLPF